MIANRLHTTLASLLLALPLTISAAPKEDEPEIWYQVEVIIFEQQDKYGDEQSRRDIQLFYPDNFKELVNPALEEITEQIPSLEDELQSDTDLGQLPELDAEMMLASTDIQQLPTGDSITSDAVDFNDPLDAALDKGPKKEQPFEQLAEDIRQLNPDARAIGSRNNYRVLFHQAWRQPGIGRLHAPWILVRGGDRYGEHFELEGSIRFVKSRYRHFETNLWLTKFDKDFGQEREVWPLLPAYPVIPELEEDSSIEQPTPMLEQHSDPLQRDVEFGAEFSEPVRSEFVISEINHLSAKRRMKKEEEVHYLDHPRLGVIVKVTKYEVPEVVEMDQPAIRSAAPVNQLKTGPASIEKPLRPSSRAERGDPVP